MPKLHYKTLRARAERIQRMVWDRAWKLAQEAGCGHPIHMHNAMVGLEYGNPWKDIDYKKLKRARWIMSKQWDAMRALDKLYTQKGYYAFDWS